MAARAAVGVTSAAESEEDDSWARTKSSGGRRVQRELIWGVERVEM